MLIYKLYANANDLGKIPAGKFFLSQRKVKKWFFLSVDIPIRTNWKAGAYQF